MTSILPLGLELPGEPSVPEMMAVARQAEELGYESIWLTETRFTRDAVTTTSALATATHSARIATAVVNPFTRNAVLAAVTAATLDEVCAGRFVLGIGPGSPTVLARQGIRFHQPLVRLRETVDIVRGLLRGEAVSFSSETMSVTEARLDFTPVRPAIPIYLGVTGPKALALAGEIADGVILNGFVSLEYTKRAIEIVRSSARASGRDPDEIEITGSVVVSVDANRQGALDVVRPLVALYLDEFPNVARESGIPSNVVDHITAVRRREGSQAAAALVTDTTVTDLTCAGTIAEVQEGLSRRREAGVELPIASFAHSSMLSWLGQLVQ
jgi:5,10-methylenetetrahydromethanopterin reductase